MPMSALEVRDPQRIGPWGGEVALHEVGRPEVRGVGLGGEPILGPGGASDPGLAHEAGHLVPADVVAGPPRRLGQLAASVDRVIVHPESDQQRDEDGVTESTRRGRPGLGVVVGGGGDLEQFADRLDPPSTPTGLTVAVGVDEGDYFVRRRSSSAPKKVAAAWRMSFARRSSLFSLRSVTSSSCSAVVTPG